MTGISSRSIPHDRTPTSYDGNDIILRPFTAVVDKGHQRIATIVNNDREKSPLATVNDVRIISSGTAYYNCKLFIKRSQFSIVFVRKKSLTSMSSSRLTLRLSNVLKRLGIRV